MVRAGMDVRGTGDAVSWPYDAPMSLIFVYGSLKQGFPNSQVNTGLRRAGTFRTREPMPLYLLGDGHVPCLVLSPGMGHRVNGEVYEVTKPALFVMDRLERLGEPDGYQRVSIEVEEIAATPNVVLLVEVYVKSAVQIEAGQLRSGPLIEYTMEHAARFSWRGAD